MQNRLHPLHAVRLLLLIVTALTFWSAPAPSAASDDEGGSVWGADYFPNIPLVTHEGKRVRFFDDLIEGKVVLINFFYASCPDVCPLETARLREVQKLLGNRVGREVFMYSITIDPERDTPEVLQKYVQRFEIDPGWLFLTGEKEDILRLRKKVAMYRADEPELSQHGTNLMLGNQGTGQWMKSTPFENPYFLVSRIRGLLDTAKRPVGETDAEKEAAESPILRRISKGESIFRTRCSPCHTIGAKEEEEQPKKAIGPDLLGVTEKRDRTWLERWLAEPDTMLEEKDPLAIALLEKWNNLAMPNLHLNEVEIESLLEYIAEESRGRTFQGRGEHHHPGPGH